jgi:hypothetical protein
MYLLHSQPVLPSEEYVSRRNSRQSRADHYEKIHIRLGNFRVVLFALAVFMMWASFRAHYLSPWWLAVPVATFGVVAVYHSRILRARDLSLRAVAFYEPRIGGMTRKKPASDSMIHTMFTLPTSIFSASPAYFNFCRLLVLAWEKKPWPSGCSHRLR